MATDESLLNADETPHMNPGDPLYLDHEVGAQPPNAKRTHHFGKALREWMIVIVIAIAAAVLMKVFVVQQFYVSGHSMDHTLHDFDRVLVNKLSYDLHDPRRGDIVVLEEAQGLTQRDLIKRVIALPGETIEITNCVVLIDGKVLIEPYLDPTVVTPNNCGGDVVKTTVTPHHVFVMGDNRPGSGDSRGPLGQVDYSQIVGRAFVVIWPKSHWAWL
jgi:signal peptidase I